VGVTAAAFVGLLLLAAAPPDRFRDANEAARGGDYPKAIAGYAEVAASGAESASLYWNWAQAASARGASGEALFALLRARELEPGDRAVARDIERVRQAANLDPAELAPEPLAALGRWCRRLHLSLLALALAAASVALHAGGRLVPRGGRFTVAGLWSLAAAIALGALPLVASLARPTAVVVRRGAPLLEAASATAPPVGALREGEVLPVLDDGGAFLRVEDSSGARGWAHVGDVRRLDRAPAELGT
jgi:hypothetical protein